MVSTSAAGNDKDIILRVESIEKLVNWINIITEAASLEYNGMEGYWIKGERKKAEQSNPKSYLLRSTTTPVDDHIEKDKLVSFSRIFICIFICICIWVFIFSC